MKKNKVNEITLPPEMTLVGIFKLKDVEGRKAIRIKINGDVGAIIVQKVMGENNKIIVATEQKTKEEPKIIVPKDLGKITT